MPRYYFHIRDHDRLIPDEEGLDLPDDGEAKLEAEASAGDLIRDALLSGEDVHHQTLEIVNAKGRVIATVALSDRSNHGRH